MNGAMLGLEDRVIAALRRITRAIDLHSRLLLKRCGLTAPQLAALRAIQRLGSISAGTLAREIHLGQATVTGILGRLESRGLVVRARGDRDRRSVLVELTPAGAELIAQAPSPLQERFRQELSRLQEWERTMILATLQRIAAMMDADAIEAAPLLGSGLAGAHEEDLSRFLERAVSSAEESPAVETEAN
ncbi:MAG: MarR family transcriptional regulator [Pirellulales bacterium]|nr:MarR family transcriptional regulator [Pirellulales bacterium]